MNRFSQEISPYLLQHKDNPVHWRVGRTLAEAKSETSILLGWLRRLPLVPCHGPREAWRTTRSPR